MLFVGAEEIGHWGVMKDGASCRISHHGCPWPIYQYFLTL